MKKNLRVVSVVAATLLAVAPVAAIPVSNVLAASVIIEGSVGITTPDAATFKLNIKNQSDLADNDPTSKLQVTLVTSTLPAGAMVKASDAKVYTDVEVDSHGKGLVGKGTEIQNFAAGTDYYVTTTATISKLTPGKIYSIAIGDGVYSLKADDNGEIAGIGVISNAFKLFDKTKTGKPIVKEGSQNVTAGSVDLTSSENSVDAIVAKIIAKYAVKTDGTAGADFSSIKDDIRASLRAAGINVNANANGTFTNPGSSFLITLNLLADNGTTDTFVTIVHPAPLPVPSEPSNNVSSNSAIYKTIHSNVNVPIYDITGTLVTNTNTVLTNGTIVATYGTVIINGKSYTRLYSANSNKFIETKYVESPTTPVIPSKPTPTAVKRIMHNSYIYDANHRRIGNKMLAAYSYIDVYGGPTRLADGSLVYKIVNDQYVMADNIDGTARTLTHNAYVYKTSRKRADGRVLYRGTTV
ncbi:hypothetical protein EQ500_01055, partial [Lactobacillus sp. XV13L]|nr:hypothetical protein [Lactobacillus sp. XV13L]